MHWYQSTNNASTLACSPKCLICKPQPQTSKLDPAYADSRQICCTRSMKCNAIITACTDTWQHCICKYLFDNCNWPYFNGASRGSSFIKGAHRTYRLRYMCVCCLTWIPASYAFPVALFPILSEDFSQLTLRPGIHNVLSSGWCAWAHAHVQGGCLREAEPPVSLIHLTIMATTVITISNKDQTNNRVSLVRVEQPYSMHLNKSLCPQQHTMHCNRLIWCGEGPTHKCIQDNTAVISAQMHAT